MNPERYPPLYRWRPYAWRKSIIGSDPDKVAYDLLIRKSEDLLLRKWSNAVLGILGIGLGALGAKNWLRRSEKAGAFFLRFCPQCYRGFVSVKRGTG